MNIPKIIPIGGLIKWIASEPKYIQRLFKEEIRDLICGDLDWKQKQEIPHNVLNKYFKFVDVKASTSIK